MAEWPPFGKNLLTRLTVCSLCIMSICNFGCFQFWFRGQDFGSNCMRAWLLHILCVDVKRYTYALSQVDHIAQTK